LFELRTGQLSLLWGVQSYRREQVSFLTNGPLMELSEPNEVKLPNGYRVT